MTTKEVAARFDALVKEGKWDVIVAELYSDDAVSIEPEHSQGLQTVKGKAAMQEKGKQFNEMIAETHGGYCTDAVVGGSFFSVAMGLDVTLKSGDRVNMEEIAVYEVKDGKIVSEQFFYGKE